MACHGVSGNSATDQFPNIAGQVPGYIAAQLAEYKSGARNNPIMAGMAAPLSAQDMANLDAYYSSLESKKGAITPAQEADALAGGKIYRGGYKPYNIAACMGCHGPSGHGIPSRLSATLRPTRRLHRSATPGVQIRGAQKSHHEPHRLPAVGPTN